MRFHLITSSGSLDESRLSEYNEHLDSLRARLPDDLYQMLRDPKAAYLARRSIYDSTIVQWHEDMDLAAQSASLEVAIVEAWRKWRFALHFREDVEIIRSPECVDAMLGRLYFLEVALTEEGRLAFSFIDSLRRETVVTCGEFRFGVESLS